MATANSFDADGVRLAYDDFDTDDTGDTESPPIVLVHGFASSRANNWEARDWYDTLLEAGRRVIALDCRGHGESETPHDPAAYETDVLAADVVRLLDDLEIERADLLGYSMGGRIGCVAAKPPRYKVAGLWPATHSRRCTATPSGSTRPSWPESVRRRSPKAMSVSESPTASRRPIRPTCPIPSANGFAPLPKRPARCRRPPSILSAGRQRAPLHVARMARNENRKQYS